MKCCNDCYKECKSNISHCLECISSFAYTELAHKGRKPFEVTEEEMLEVLEKALYDVSS